MPSSAIVAGTIAEADIVEADLAAGDAQWPGAGRSRIAGSTSSTSKIRCAAARPSCSDGVQIGEALHRLIGEQQRGDEREEGAGVRAPLITWWPP